MIGTASSEVPNIERRDLEQALKKAPLFLAFIFSYFWVFLAEQWNHDVTASSKTGILPNCSFGTVIRSLCSESQNETSEDLEY